MTVTQKIEIGDLPKVAKKTAAQVKAAAKRGAEAAGRRLLREAVMLARSDRSNGYPLTATGAYENSFEIKVTQKNIILINKSPYAGAVEYGRAPGKPPPPRMVIAYWMKHKGIMLANGKAGAGNWRLTKKVAYMIARAIGRRGIHGRHIIARAVAASQSAMFAAIAAEVKK